MTKKELSQCYYLRREIEADQERLERLKAEAYHAPAPKISDEPSGPRTNEGRTERLALEIIDLEAIIAAKQIQRIHELLKLERFIAEIDDSLTRQIFSYRHVDGLRWEDVARMVGGNNTGDSVRMLHDRFLKKSDEE